MLYRTVQTYWPIFLKEQERVGKSIPHFIKDEFDDFLKCGLPEFGFVRTYCYQCRDSGIVAFSCKRRGFCPSCCARRMNDEAAHIVENILPEVAVRQWVLSFPYKLRFKMAFDQKLTSKILNIFIQSLSRYYKKRAKKIGIKKSNIGSITFIQRFGSALNLNIHFHTLVADGVFSEEDHKFKRLPEPTQDELRALAEKIYQKVTKLIEKKYSDDQIEFLEENHLAHIAENSITHKAQYGDRKGNGLKRYGLKNLNRHQSQEDPYSVNIEGFSLNAKVWVGGRDRQKLEKLIRYTARGPIATERLSESFPDKLIYKMKSRWRDGTTHVSFSYLDFIARLVALIPPPRMNLIRYHGVFAPNYKKRKIVVPQSAQKQKDPETDILCDLKAKRERMRWSDMLKRTFEIDVTVCKKCSGRVEQIAVIKDRVVAQAILDSLNIASIFRPLDVILDRGPPNDREVDYEYSQVEVW